MKAILMSIRPQHLVNILNGKKTIELRKRFPKDFMGWVYLYCTKGTLYFNSYENEWQTSKVDRKLLNPNLFHCNGKVVCRFWVDNVEETITINYASEHFKRVRWDLSTKSCVSIKDLNNYFKGKAKAIHISKLEIFDKPMELNEFYKIKYRTEFEEQYTPIKQAPQSWQYIYIRRKNYEFI